MTLLIELLLYRVLLVLLEYSARLTATGLAWTRFGRWIGVPEEIEGQGMVLLFSVIRRFAY